MRTTVEEVRKCAQNIRSSGAACSEGIC